MNILMGDALLALSWLNLFIIFDAFSLKRVTYEFKETIL